MKIKEIKIGTYNEWKKENPETAEKILEKYREINTEYNWYDCVIEDFCQNVENFGFNVEPKNVHFTGFWSQGDGASFTGDIDVLEYLKHEKKLTKYRNVVRKINDDKIAQYADIVRTSSRYSHEKTCGVDILDNYEEVSDKVFDEVKELTEELEEKRYDLCRDIYKALEEQYYFLVSDESVTQTLVENEYEFDENGDIQ